MSFEISSERPENQFKYPAWGPFTSLGTRSQIKSSEPVKSPALQGADPRPTSLSLPLHTDLSILVVLESDKQVLPMFPPPSLPQGRSEARVLGHRHLWATLFLGKPFVMEGLCPPPALCSPCWLSSHPPPRVLECWSRSLRLLPHLLCMANSLPGKTWPEHHSSRQPCHSPPTNGEPLLVCVPWVPCVPLCHRSPYHRSWGILLTLDQKTLQASPFFPSYWFWKMKLMLNRPLMTLGLFSSPL